MRRIFFFAMMLVTSLVIVAQDNTEAANVSTGEPFMAFLADEGQGTNILNKARGATVMTLSSDFDYIFNLTAPQDGWWKVLEIWRVGDDDSEVVLEGSDTGEYWIHHSALGLATRNYGQEELYLREAPDEGAKVIYTFNKELLLMPLDIQGDWVKVKVDGYDIIGWIEAEWLCSNPLTNCC